MLHTVFIQSLLLVTLKIQLSFSEKLENKQVIESLRVIGKIV